MADELTLVLVVAALCLYETLAFVPSDAVTFRDLFGLGYRALRPSPLLGSRPGGSLVLANPFPALGALRVCQEAPIAIAPRGIVASDGRFVGFDGMTAPAASGKVVRANGAEVARLATPALAARLARLVDEVRKTPEGGRAAALRAARRASLDAGAARERLAAVSARLRPLRLACAALTLVLLVALPALVLAGRFERSWPGLLVAWALATPYAIVRWLDAVKAADPTDRGDVFTHVLSAALAPPAASRVGDGLERDALAATHPLAAASVLLDEPRFLAFARRALREARHPLPPAVGLASAECFAAIEFDRAERVAAAEAFLRRAGVEPESLLEPPARATTESVAWCERCEAQFGSGVETCADCGGAALRRFASG